MIKKLFFSLFSGTLYEVYETEVKNLDEGQIPLKKKPSSSCSHCFGRGYEFKDVKKSIYPICRCMRKCIQDGYQPVNIHLLPALDPSEVRPKVKA